MDATVSFETGSRHFPCGGMPTDPVLYGWDPAANMDIRGGSLPIQKHMGAKPLKSTMVSITDYSIGRMAIDADLN